MSAISANAQYAAPIYLETGGYYSGVACDNDGHVYVVRRNSAGTNYEVAKYTYGTGTPTVIYNNLAYIPASNIYPWGIMVNDNGVVFVTNPVSQWEIIKLTPGAGGLYTSEVVRSGGWVSALGKLPVNRLMAIEHIFGSPEYYRIKVLEAGQETQPGSHLALPLTIPPAKTTYPWGVAADGSDNFYVLDLHENNGGQILRVNFLPAGGGNAYSTHDLIGPGKYYTALAIDKDDNFYTTERVGGVYRVVKRTDIMDPNGQLLLDGLSTNGAALPWGLAVNQWGQVYVGDGSSATGGRLVMLSPLVNVENVKGIGNLRTNANNITYTVIFSAPVQNMDVRAFSLATIGITGASVTSFTQTSATTYTVSVNTGTGSGRLRLQVNRGMLPDPGNVPFTSGDEFEIDKGRPAVGLVTPPDNGIYNAGDVMTFKVSYTERVMVTGTPLLPVTIGGTTVQASYVAGSGNLTHTFSYTVQPGDMDMDGIELNAGINPNGGTLRDEVGNDLEPALNNVPSTAGVKVNTASPSVTLSTTAASLVKAPFTITATFSEAVTGFTVGDINISNGVLSNLATSDNIIYTATVTPTADGIITVHMPAGGALNAGENPNTASNTLNLTYDGTKPTVTAVSPPANRTYKALDVLDFKVRFDEQVTVTGSPTLSVVIGSTTVQFPLAGNGLSDVLSFGYTVQNGQEDADGVTLTSTSIALNGGTIRDAAGNDAIPVLNNAGATAGVLVDAVAPVVTGVQVPANGNYVTGDVLSFTVQMSEQVTVNTGGGVPSLNVIIGSTTVQAAYAGGTGTGALTFSHTVLTGEQDLNGIALGSIVLNGGTLRDAAGNNAVTTLNNVGVTANVLVNAAKPGVTLSTTAGSVPVHEPFTTTIVFTEAVTGFTLTDFAATNATLSNLQTTDNITYTVLATPVTDGTVTVSVPANAAQNGSNIGNTASNVVTVHYDGSAPAIVVVSVPADGIYRSGDVLSFSASFSENVTVTGTPSFDITIGSTVRQAQYVSGGFTNALTFQYAVQDGELDMDGITPGSRLSLNSGSIRDAAGNNAVLIMNNTGNTSGVLVNTLHPTVTLNGTPAPNAPFTLTATFSEPVTGLALTDFAVTNATLSNLLAANNVTYTLTVTPVADGAVSIGLPANAAQNAGANGNSASNVINYTYDGTAPVITSVSVPANGYYKTGETLHFTVHFSENVTVIAAAGINLTIGNDTMSAVYTGGTGTNALAFSYTVKNGDLDMDGIAVNRFNPGAIFRDAAGNNASPVLHNTGNTSGVFVNTRRPSATFAAIPPGRVNTPVTVTLTFSEAVTGLAATDLTVANGTAGNLQTSNNITYTALITPAADGAVSVTLPADAAANVAGNGNSASNTVSFTYDATAPVITAGQRFTISQYSAAGTTVGQVAATAGADALQNWALATTGAFEITTTGVLRVKDAALLGPLGGTTVTLLVTVSDGLNTSAPTPVSVQVDLVNQAPTLDPIANISTCADTETHTIQLTGASATEPAQTYSITATAAADVFDQLAVSTANVLSYRLKAGAAPGSTTVTVTIKDNGGTANGGVDALQRSFTVTVASPPAVTITSDKGATISKGDVVRLTAAGGATYLWADAGGIVGERQSATLEVRPMANTTYTVTATNAAGCTGTASASIAVLNDFKVDATNILTPNGDGRNDRWVIRNIDSYPNNEVKIFDRTGRIVYQRRNYSNDWAGTANGSPLAEGTYYYILTIDNGAATAKGYITIVRDAQ